MKFTVMSHNVSRSFAKDVIWGLSVGFLSKTHKSTYLFLQRTRLMMMTLMIAMMTTYSVTRWHRYTLCQSSKHPAQVVKADTGNMLKRAYRYLIQLIIFRLIINSH